MKSPCHDCEVHYSRADKERHPECRQCRARQRYAHELGAMSRGVPMHMPEIRPPHPINGDRPPAFVYPWDVVEDVCRLHNIDPENLQAAKWSKRAIRTRKEIVRRLSLETDLSRKEIALFVGVAENSVNYIWARLGIDGEKRHEKSLS